MYVHRGPFREIRGPGGKFLIRGPIIRGGGGGFRTYPKKVSNFSGQRQVKLRFKKKFQIPVKTRVKRIFSD